MTTLAQDELMAAFLKARDIVVHQRNIVRDSRVQMGLFRNTTLKLALRSEVHTDAPSDALLMNLQRVNEAQGHFFVPEDHPAIGEQLGVSRLYFVPQLSDTLDVISASHAAWMRVGQLLADAHALFDLDYDSIEPGGDAEAHSVDRVALLLESDLDGSLPAKWGWAVAVPADGGSL